MLEGFGFRVQACIRGGRGNSGVCIDIAEADIVGIAWTPLSFFRCHYFCGLFLVRSMPISEKPCCVEPLVNWAVCCYQKFLVLFVCKICDIVPLKCCRRGVEVRGLLLVLKHLC